MDIEMPVKNGYSAAEEIRDFLKEQYTGKQPIIIACTAYVSDEDNQKAINHGMDDFIKNLFFKKVWSNFLRIGIARYLKRTMKIIILNSQVIIIAFHMILNWQTFLQKYLRKKPLE